MRSAGRPSNRTGTADEILDVAERLVQHRGFNAFSYADVAAELGVTKPALHYHFPTKAALAEALVARYTERFTEARARIDERGGTGRARLESYIELYERVVAEDRMCLCGILAAEHPTLPEPVREQLRAFFDDNVAWLAGVLEAGRRDGSLSGGGSAREGAQMILATLEGAMLLARPYGDGTRFRIAASRILDDLGPAPKHTRALRA